MFDRDVLYNVLDAHFVGHLLREGEAAADADDAEGEGETQAQAVDTPDNMLDDLIDELDGVLEELHEDYDDSSKALTAIAIGFIDGVLAQSNDSYSTYEDEYFEDAGNEAYAAVDEFIADFAGIYEGNRDWGEAAMGYVRRITAPEGNGPADFDPEILGAQAQGFVYGVDLCEDYEWKVIQPTRSCVLVTDEEAIEEFSMRQLEASGYGSVFDRVFDALGLDLNALEAAFSEGEDDDEDGEGQGEAESAAGK